MAMTARPEPTSFTEWEAQILTALYQLRLLRTSQLHALVMPNNTDRYLRSLLTGCRDRLGLRQRGYIDGIDGKWGAEGKWFVTAKGAAEAESVLARRIHRMTAAKAGGMLQAHTLAVNDVCVALMRAARDRGDEFAVEDYEHEVAHPLVPRPGRKWENVLIADAIAHYTIRLDGQVGFLARFIEMDRATTGRKQLVDKLRAYARLLAYPDGWRRYLAGSTSRTFPRVVVVVDGVSEPRMAKRIAEVAELCAYEREITAAGADLSISFTTLVQMREAGPFGHIFTEVGVDRPVDLLGRPAC